MMSNRKIALLVTVCLALGLTAAVFIRSAASGTTAVTPDVPVAVPASGIGLFARVATGADAAAATAANQVSQLLSGTDAAVPQQWKPGQQLIGTARTALTAGDLSVWAYKSANGKVCEGLAVAGTTHGAGCTGGWSARLPVDVNVDGLAQGSQVVWGLTPDDVSTVDVVVDGVAHPATLGNNAYLFKTAGTAISAVVVTHDDGTVSRFSLEQAPNPLG
jgi:hypothetical protein